MESFILNTDFGAHSHFMCHNLAKLFSIELTYHIHIELTYHIHFKTFAFSIKFYITWHFYFTFIYIFFSFYSYMRSVISNISALVRSGWCGFPPFLWVLKVPPCGESIACQTQLYNNLQNLWLSISMPIQCKHSLKQGIITKTYLTFI